MRFHVLEIGSCLLGLSYARPQDLNVPSTDIDTAFRQVTELQRQAEQATLDALPQPGADPNACTSETLQVRQEWSRVPDTEKREYIRAALCVQELAANTPSHIVAGAKNRFDDFVATHINQTLTIHFTGTFLGWHRLYTWAYERTLREECGYIGTQPYWDWTLTARDGLRNHPLFDGSDTSISGDGRPEESAGDIVLSFNTLGTSLGGAPVILPTGTGGGCIYDGPFANMSVNLGPILLPIPGNETISQDPERWFDYNPRCVRRDLTDEVNQRLSNASSVITLLLESTNIRDFQLDMQGGGVSDIGVHGGGHYSIGGDPGRDVFVSPGDPIFYFQHSQIDRVWWLWQNMDRQTRVYGGANESVAGT